MKSTTFTHVAVSAAFVLAVAFAHPVLAQDDRPAFLEFSSSTAHVGVAESDEGPGWGAEEDREPARRTTFSRLVVPTTLGSLAGAAGGALWGASLEWGEGNYRGLEGALLLGILGGTLGSATGAWLADRGQGDTSYGSASLAAGLGAVGGLLGALTLTEISDGKWEFTGLYVGFAVGQGILTAAVASSLDRL